MIFNNILNENFLNEIKESNKDLNNIISIFDLNLNFSNIYIIKINDFIYTKSFKNNIILKHLRLIIDFLIYNKFFKNFDYHHQSKSIKTIFKNL